MKTVSDLSERELIARIQTHLPQRPDWLVVGIGDDAAVVETERNRLEVLSVDAVVEGIHFDRRFTPPAAIGHRALAVNLSDLAAMGAAPRLALLSFALPPTLGCSDFDAIVAGLAALASVHRLHVVGGNLTRSPGPLMIDVTVVGTVKRRQVLQRNGAHPGDGVYMSGSIGAAAAGLQILRRKTESSAPDPDAAPAAAEDCVHRYLYPEPRLRLGLLLGRNRAASACMDLSDGLADGLHQVSRESGVGMIIDANLLPISQASRAWSTARGADPVTDALAGGDDYELIFTARPRLRGRLKTVVRHSDVPITRIGVCTEDGQVMIRRMVDGTSSDTPAPKGFGHFA